MPNWADQNFSVIGPPEDIDRFCALAVSGNFRRDHSLDDEPRFHFDRVCPYREADRPPYDDEHADAVLYQFTRSRTQAHFWMQSSWSYPEHFYTVRLPRDWPSLQFTCAINEDMGNYQGVIAGIGGTVTDTVEECWREGYNRRRHLRRVRTLAGRWTAIDLADRPWVVVLPFRYRSRVHYDADARFFEEGHTLWLRTEAEVRRLLRGRTAAQVFRLSARTGRAHEVRAMRRGELSASSAGRRASRGDPK